MNELSHINNSGLVQMVNTADKTATKRSATARSVISVPTDVLGLLENGEIRSPKGAVFQTAIIAGIMAAKRTGDLIPLCHPIGLDHCDIVIRITKEHEIEILCTASVFAKTGVEMEALTGASVAALTIYDMCKAVSHDIVIRETLLIEKKGGKNDFTRTAE